MCKVPRVIEILYLYLVCGKSQLHTVQHPIQLSLGTLGKISHLPNLHPHIGNESPCQPYGQDEQEPTGR